MLLRLATLPSLFGLAPGGVYPAAPVAGGAVRFCRPVSPLPAGCLAAPCTGGLFSVALSLGSPPPEVIRHRIPVEPGLSSAGSPAAAVRPSGSGRDGRRRGPASRLPRQCSRAVDRRQWHRERDAGQGQTAVGADDLWLLRPVAVRASAKQLRLDPRAVDCDRIATNSTVHANGHCYHRFWAHGGTLADTSRNPKFKISQRG